MAPWAAASCEAGRQPALSTIRAEPKSRTAKLPFTLCFPGTSLVWTGGNRYLAGSQLPMSEWTGPQPMRPIVYVLIQIINLYMYLLIASAILSWLIAFNVVNTRNQFVAGVAEFLYRITEPVLGPIRRRLPNFGGLDISPIIAFFALMLIQMYLADYVYPYVP